MTPTGQRPSLAAVPERADQTLPVLGPQLRSSIEVLQPVSTGQSTLTSNSDTKGALTLRASSSFSAVDEESSPSSALLVC